MPARCEGERPRPDRERRPQLAIYLLKWDVALLYTLSRQVLPLAALDLIANGRTHLRFDSKHPA